MSFLRERLAAAEQRGREDNANHSMCYVYGSQALQARLAEVWWEGHREVCIDCNCRPEINPYQEKT